MKVCTQLPLRRRAEEREGCRGALYDRALLTQADRIAHWTSVPSFASFLCMLWVFAYLPCTVGQRPQARQGGPPTRVLRASPAVPSVASGLVDTYMRLGRQIDRDHSTVRVANCTCTQPY